MARKTKSELALEAANAQAYREAEAEATHFPRLMEALAQSTKQYFDLTVKDGLFMVTDHSINITFTMSPTYDHEAWGLENLEYHLEEKETARLEEEARYLAKQVALSKLTKEEKELLGL